MEDQHLNLGRSYTEDGRPVREFTAEEFEIILKGQKPAPAQPRRAIVGIVLAMATGALAMHIFDSRKAAQAVASARAQALTEALQDNQPRVFAAGEKAGAAEGFASGRLQGLEEGKKAGYRQGAEAMAAKLKPVALDLVAQANRRTGQALQSREDLRQRAQRIIMHQQLTSKARRPCYSGYNIDIRLLFGAGVKIGGNKPSGCHFS